MGPVLVHLLNCRSVPAVNPSYDHRGIRGRGGATKPMWRIKVRHGDADVARA
jgi:hypothetical protein